MLISLAVLRVVIDLVGSSSLLFISYICDFSISIECVFVYLCLVELNFGSSLVSLINFNSMREKNFVILVKAGFRFIVSSRWRYMFLWFIRLTSCHIPAYFHCSNDIEFVDIHICFNSIQSFYARFICFLNMYVCFMYIVTLLLLIWLRLRRQRTAGILSMRYGYAQPNCKHIYNEKKKKTNNNKTKLQKSSI